MFGIPQKSLDWHLLAPDLGQAREALARYDETLRSIPEPILEILKWEEAIATLRSQDIHANLLEVLRFSLDRAAEEQRALLLQKIMNAKEALDLSIAWAYKKPLNLSFLRKLHAILKKDAFNQDEIGRWRKRQNWIGPRGSPLEKAYFFPPKAHLVPKYLKDWQAYQNKKEEPLVQLAILFAQLLIIHPFMDGNGRVARNHIPVFLFKRKLLSKPYLFLSSYFEERRPQYVHKLFNISETNDWEGWILYFLKGIVARSERMKTQVERIKCLYLKVGLEEAFLHPVTLKKKKALTERSDGLFVFKPLFEAIR